MYEGKKIMWVDSYHADYEWSAGIESGLKSIVEGSGAELQIIRLDTKRNTSEAFGKAAGLEAEEEIKKFAPDVVIACDDNAQKYLVVPHLMDTELPVIFCGVNWDASIYGYPASNVTGMVEVELPEQMVELLKPYANGERIAYLTAESETENKVAEIYNERFFDGEMILYAVNSVDEFKSAFLTAQNEADILFMGNNAGLNDWDEVEMEQFILVNSRIPSGTINPWMTPYSLLTLAKSPEEQGVWAGETALRVLEGTAINDIAISENKEGKLILNFNLADKLDAVFSPSMMRNAEIYGD